MYIKKIPVKLGITNKFVKNDLQSRPINIVGNLICKTKLLLGTTFFWEHVIKSPSIPNNLRQ